MATYTEPRSTTTATIAINESLSGAVDLEGVMVVGIVMPAGWTAADLTFQFSADGTTYGNVYNEAGAEFTIDAAVDRFIQVQPEHFWGARYLKVRSGTAGSAVAQDAARTITLVTRPI